MRHLPAGRRLRHAQGGDLRQDHHRRYDTAVVRGAHGLDLFPAHVSAASLPYIQRYQKPSRPSPPLPEQHEIVRRVESFFALADQLEARYLKAKTHVDKLTQSILAKAFRGELVAQDPNDEPASVLLERIRTRRAEPAPARRRVVPFRPSRQNYTIDPEPLPLAAEPPATYIATIPQRILATLQPGREYSRSEITAASGITDAEWTWAIRQLREEGKVTQTGERRWARYRQV